MVRPRSAYLAIDLGASSGRGVVGVLDASGMHLKEVHRFRTPMIELHGHLFWDIEALATEVLRSLTAALEHEPALRAVSVDSWGVDYVPLAADGSLVRAPYAYRDGRTAGRMRQAAQMIGGAQLYAITGIQFLDINTLPQILADVSDEPALLSQTASRLLIADFLLYRMSGVRVAERTLVSTTQLMDIRTGEWSVAVMEGIGDDARRWPRIVPPGTVLGPVLPSLLPASAASHAPVVIATCSHDTAAAVAAVPADAGVPWAFISSGTWSLVGAEIDAPILSASAQDAGFTNEAGVDDTIRFLKNRMGMWVFEECAREWQVAGNQSAYAAMLNDAERAPSCGVTLDLNTPEFAQRGAMLATLATACRACGIALPADRRGIVRLILESIAASLREAIEQLDALLGRRSAVIHIVGGGSRIRLLNQLTADACGRRVVAGPYEATALGNLLVQARALGDLPDGMSIRQVAARSTTLEFFEPADSFTSPTCQDVNVEG